jgi:hypothetical protein
MMHTGEKRREFVLKHWRLQDLEPFRFLREFLSGLNETHIEKIGPVVLTKFSQEKQSKNYVLGISQALSLWLEYLRIAEFDQKNVNVLKPVKGNIITPVVFSLLEVEFLSERALRDWYSETFDNSKAILDEPRNILIDLSKEVDDEKRGEMFKRFIVACALRLGFTYRTQDSIIYSNSKISFKDNSGGGDIVLFFHHPVESRKETFEGGAIACEAKSTESNVGSKAVGQARNLSAKVRLEYPKYVVFPIVVSRSKCGFDQSGRDQATPDVVHITEKILMGIIEQQREQLNINGNLVLPSHFLMLLDSLIRDESLEPNEVEVRKRVQGLL